VSFEALDYTLMTVNLELPFARRGIVAKAHDAGESRSPP
jgi:hypothetical protein